MQSKIIEAFIFLQNYLNKVNGLNWNFYEALKNNQTIYAIIFFPEINEYGIDEIKYNDYLSIYPFYFKEEYQASYFIDNYKNILNVLFNKQNYEEYN